MSHTARVLRTAVQAALAFLVALPLALAKVPIPDKYQGSVALVLGIAAGLVVVISAIQNAIEAFTGVALFRNATAGTKVPAPVVQPPTVPPDAAPGQPRGPP
jgi:hypothetical protein